MTHFHNVDTKIAMVGVVCLIYVYCLFLQANEGRKDDHCNAKYQFYLSTLHIFFEGPVTDVVASYQVSYACSECALKYLLTFIISTYFKS